MKLSSPFELTSMTIVSKNVKPAITAPNTTMKSVMRALASCSGKKNGCERTVSAPYVSSHFLREIVYSAAGTTNAMS